MCLPRWFSATISLLAILGNATQAAERWQGHDSSRFSSGFYAAISQSLPAFPTPAPHSAGASPLSAAATERSYWLGPQTWLGADPAPLTRNLNQAEPHICRHPLRPELLAALFQDGRLSDGGADGSGLALSTDGGVSWTRGFHPRLTRLDGTGNYFRATDPVVSFDLLGSLYTCHLVSTNADFSSSQVVVSRSDDGGTTFGQPFIVTSSVYQSSRNNTFPDKNWMVINNFPNTSTTGRIICTWTRFRVLETTHRYEDASIFLSYSDDRGQTWSTPREISDPAPPWTSNKPFSLYDGGYQGSLPLYLPNGHLFVPFWRFADDYGPVQHAIQFALSTNGGTTFLPLRPTIREIPTVYTDPYARSAGFIFSGCVSAQTGTVFLAYQALDDSGNPGIQVIRSLSQDQNETGPQWTWSTPLVVSDPPPGVSVFAPTISASSDGRHVVVSYYDKRRDPQNRYLCDVWLAESLDGGLTWQPSVPLSEQPIDMRRATLTPGGYMLGDYFGIAPPTPDEPSFVALWIADRSTQTDPFVTRVAAPPDHSAYERWRLIRWPGSADGASPDADADGDGLSNFLEFSQLSDPRSQTAAMELPYRDRYFHPSQDDEIILTVPRLADTLLYQWQQSDDGATWWTEAGSNTEITPFPVYGYDRWRIIVPGLAQRKTFLRLLVTDLNNVNLSGTLINTPHPLGGLTVVDEQSGWLASPRFGWFYGRAFPYLYHWELGWLYVYALPSVDLWLYDPVLGWLYTRQDWFPDLFSFSKNAWMRHYPTREKPRLFFNYNLGTFEDHPLSEPSNQRSVDSSGR